MITTNANFDAANALTAKNIVTWVEIDTYTDIFETFDTGFTNHKPWIKSISRRTQKINDLRGSSALSDLKFTVLDKGNSITADFPGFIFEGKKVTVKTGFSSLVEGDFVTVFEGVIDRVDAGDNNNTYTFVCKNKARATKEKVYLIGDDAVNPVSKDNLKTVEGNPLQILRDILLTELSVPAGNVDTARIDAYRDTIFAGYTFRFELKNSVEAKKFLEQEILAPLGGYLWTNYLGKVSVNFFSPLATDDLDAFQATDQNLLDIPVPKQTELINVVTHRFDNAGSEFNSENVEIWGASETKYGMQGSHILQSKGMRSTLQGFTLSRFIAKSIFNSYGDKNLALSGKLFWTAVKLEPGDFLTLTHNKVPDRGSGVVGITSVRFRVKNTSWDWFKGEVILELTDATDVAPETFFKYASTTQVDWTSASSGNKDSYQFVADDATGQYSDAVAGNPLA